MKNKKLFAILTLVCFMFTLMPVAAFAADATIIADSMSVVYAEETDVNTKTDVEFGLSIRDVNSTLVKSTTNAYVWVTKEGSSVPVNTVKVDNAAAGQYIYEVTDVTTGEEQFTVSFNGAGKYQVHVSSVKPEIESGKISTTTEFTAAGAVVTATSAYNPTVESLQLNVTLPNTFKVAVDGDKTDADVAATGSGDKYTATLKDGDVAYSLGIAANNVDEKKVVIELEDSKSGPQAGKTLEIETAGAIDASKATVTTNALGKAEFTVSGNAEGTYKVYVTYGQFEAVIEVVVGATAANTIACVEEPTNPIDVLNTSLVGGLGEYVEFEMYDVNGNKLVASNEEGWKKAVKSATEKADYNYVSIVEQPAASKLENKNVWFNGTTICLNKNITVEGTYTFKVVLDNGNYATATIEVKEFQTPVKLVVEYPEAIELGSTVGFTDLYWLDANGVEKAAYSNAGAKVDLAATGYAIANYNSQDGKLTAKTDEKYVGAEITITAVDERYNLVATTVVTVADEAKELAFADKTAEVKVNNKIEVSVVDSQGKTVTLGSAAKAQSATTDISYVILDKPADAKVFVSTVDNDLLTDGTFEMNLTSNKVGNVTVQAIVKYSYVDAVNMSNVVKYYTGTQIFAVGTEGVGDVVVMSIGSNEIIINDAKGTIPAAPIVENNRTFVPFRALAEAFGAEVAWDEATQAVTASLNGVEIVMTIGSAEYTINGETATMDVAPFINGASTMVPVRFAAEAFGIKVIPTYDENGATADILFNL